MLLYSYTTETLTNSVCYFKYVYHKFEVERYILILHFDESFKK
jgi:hypothetical protein